MVAEVLRELSRAGMIREAATPGKCLRGDPNLAQNCFVTRKQIRVLILDNSPTTGTSYLCGQNGAVSSTLRQGLPQNSIVPGDEAWPPVADATFPILGAFRTQGGRGEAAELDLLGLVGGCTEQFAELRMPKPADGEAEPSMNWMLSGTSRKFIYQVLSRPDGSKGDAYIQLSQNLARVRSWLGPNIFPVAR